MNLRLDFLGVTIMAVVTSFSIMNKENIDKVLLSLIIIYTLTLTSYILDLVRAIQIIEGRMVSVHRMFKLMDVP